MSKCLWQIHLFPHLIQSDMGKSVLLLRYHHSLLDGVNIMRLLLKYTNYQYADSSTERQTKSPKVRILPFIGSYLKWGWKTLTAPRDKKNPLTNLPTLNKNSPRHIMYKTMDASVAQVKKLKEKGYSVNDVLISCLTGCFADFATKEYTEPISTTTHVSIIPFLSLLGLPLGFHGTYFEVIPTYQGR